ncbi:unnamed protein product [Caenorhabditis bovis]|uniref:Uncharacterized protein n=1 Tax=Caenorhabditis bovis TaxID=2654633 RepID=A0A8S1EBV4_9PELO|nr:unnamed protein product [Caenorhabditis bovis]
MQLFALVTIILHQSILASAALPECQGTGKCPPEGIWGEWTYVDDPVTCNTPCGSCDVKMQTRKCLSDVLKCPCIGTNSRKIPCNTQMCKAPAQRTCCIPYVPFIVNGTMQCGPITTTKGVSCCPKDGLWSEWSGFYKEGNQLVRTRDCLSQSSGCPCSGPDTQYSTLCPCKMPDFEKTCENDEAIWYSYPDFGASLSDCSAQTMLLRTDIEGDAYCSKSPIDGISRGGIVVRTVDGRCIFDKIFPCVDAIQQFRQTFTCDYESGYWRYDQTGDEIVSYSQFVYKNPNIC